MNSLKKGEGFPLLNFKGGLGVPLLNFEGSLGVSLLNFRGVPGPTFRLWGSPGCQGPEVLRSRSRGLIFTPCLTYTRSITDTSHRYQDTDTSQKFVLINSTSSFMDLVYFLHMRLVCCKYCKKYMRKSNQETFNFFGRIWTCQVWLLNICNRLSICAGNLNAWDILYVFC